MKLKADKINEHADDENEGGSKMKIDGSGSIEGQNLPANVQGAKKTDAENNSNAQKILGGKDKISLSSKAKEINELKGLIEQLPEIRTDRIEELKKAIDAGDYNIDSLKVAEKVLEEI